MIQRRSLLASALLAPALSQKAWSQASVFSRPVKIIVPLQAGGSSDVSARLIGNSLGKRLKQPIIVENKPGGTFVIGMQSVTSAPADGYTLMAVNTGMMAAQVTMKRIDMLKSLALISQFSTLPTLMVVPAKSPFSNFAELLAFAKKNPGKLNYGSVGTGGLEHLWMTMLSQKTGQEFTHIPFKGMPDAMTALVQGELDFVPCVMSVALPFVRNGALRALCVLSNERTAILPDVPSMKEQGVDVPPMEFWSGLAAPKATSAAVIETLRQELGAVVTEPEMRQKMADRGATVVTSAKSEDFVKVVRDEQLWMSQVVKEAGFKLE